MKRLMKLLLSFVGIVVLGSLVFLYSYKAKTEDFITDRTTLIYNNQNINKENLKKIEESFNIDKIEGKEYIKKIKDISILSQSKIYKDKLELVGVIDTGLYFPIIYRELKEYFIDNSDGYYILKPEYKSIVGVANSAELYATIYRGLFFLGTDKREVKKIIDGEKKDKRSFKSIEIINKNKNNDLGVFILNQERERLFGIDRVIIVGNIKENKIWLNSEIEGENEITRDLMSQPKNRKITKYIKKNTLYLSTAKINDIDTFLLRSLSFRKDNSNQSKKTNRFFRSDFNELARELNGEMLIDLREGAYIFGLDEDTDREMIQTSNKTIFELNRLFDNYSDFSIEKGTEGDSFICIGKYKIIPQEEEKKIEKNQFLYCNLNIESYGKIEIEGYNEENSLKIKSVIDLQKKR